MLGKGSVADPVVGDQFTRVEDPETIWTVRRVVHLPKLPKHAVMTCEEPVHRQILVSDLILRDRRMYRQVRIEEPASGGGDALPARWRRLFGR